MTTFIVAIGAFALGAFAATAVYTWKLLRPPLDDEDDWYPGCKEEYRK